MSLKERFWDKVDKSGPIHPTLKTRCWQWTANKMKTGYGRIKVKTGNKWSQGLAHRVAYTLMIGSVPDEIHVLHRCDNPGCVNPDHLFLGTHIENMDDKITKRRHPHGEKHGTARLTESDILEIRRRSSLGEPSTSIAPDFNVSDGHVRHILSGRYWKHALATSFRGEQFDAMELLPCSATA